MKNFKLIQEIFYIFIYLTSTYCFSLDDFDDLKKENKLNKYLIQ